LVYHPWSSKLLGSKGDPGLAILSASLSLGGEERRKDFYRRRDKRLNLPVEGRAGPPLNTGVQRLDYEPGNELGRSLGALVGARTPT
jgi:hypothetical protein